MPIVFNAAERKTISLQVVQLPQQAADAEAFKDQLDDVKDELLQQDADIKKFYDFFNSSVEGYQTERQGINGVTSTTVQESDIQESAKRSVGNLYFPSSESFTWTKFQPYVDPNSDLKGLPNGSTSDWELKTISTNLDSDLGIEALFLLLKNGQAGAAADTGSLSGGVLTATLGGQVIGSLAFITSTLVRINSAGMAPMTFNVTVILGPSSNSGAIINALPAHDNAQRNTLTSSVPAYTNLLANEIIIRIGDWEAFLNTQLAALNSNEDDRSPQAAEIAAAKADIINAKNIIDTWQALPLTGSSGTDSKFVDLNFGNIEAEITARQAFTSTRLTQIATGLGSISQAGDGTVSGSGVYKLRYDQLNNRINLTGGPLSAYWQKSMASDALQAISDTKNSQLDTFTSKMKATSLTSNSKGTQQIEVTSTADFSPSQTVYIVSETVAEITGTVASIDGPTKMTLNFIVPDTFKTADKARILRIV
jgi:hypothetical protein